MNVRHVQAHRTALCDLPSFIQVLLSTLHPLNEPYKKRYHARVSRP